MRIDLIEKLVMLKAGLAVLGVAGFVTFCSLLPGPIHSGVPQVCVDSANETLTWLDSQRRAAGRAGLAKVRVPPGEVAYRAAPPVPATTSATTSAPSTAATDYFQASGDVPSSDRIANAPWLRRVPGVSYAEPQRVSELTYRKYQAFDDVLTFAQSGGGRFVSTAEGKSAYEVSWVDERSDLATRIGLRPGDRVISVNGLPVGNGLGAAQALFEQLRGERRFAVLIERDGALLVLSFFVQ